MLYEEVAQLREIIVQAFPDKTLTIGYNHHFRADGAALVQTALTEHLNDLAAYLLNQHLVNNDALSAKLIDISTKVKQVSKCITRFPLLDFKKLKLWTLPNSSIFLVCVLTFCVEQKRCKIMD